MWKQYSKKTAPSIRFSGFTIVELTVVVITLAALFGIGYANFRDFQRRKSLESAIRLVASDLRLAKEKATSGVKDPGCGSGVLEGYYFSRTSSTDYRIDIYCGGLTITVKDNIALPQNVEMSGFGGGNQLLFKSLGHGIDRTSDVSITLDFVDSSSNIIDSRIITVTTAGEIRVP